jgi:hypothetical protein
VSTRLTIALAAVFGALAVIVVLAISAYAFGRSFF